MIIIPKTYKTISIEELNKKDKYFCHGISIIIHFYTSTRPCLFLDFSPFRFLDIRVDFLSVCLGESD